MDKKIYLVVNNCISPEPDPLFPFSPASEIEEMHAYSTKEEAKKFIKNSCLDIQGSYSYSIAEITVKDKFDISDFNYYDLPSEGKMEYDKMYAKMFPDYFFFTDKYDTPEVKKKREKAEKDFLNFKKELFNKYFNKHD